MKLKQVEELINRRYVLIKRKEGYEEFFHKMQKNKKEFEVFGIEYIIKDPGKFNFNDEYNQINIGLYKSIEDTIKLLEKDITEIEKELTNIGIDL